LSAPIARLTPCSAISLVNLFGQVDPNQWAAQGAAAGGIGGTIGGGIDHPSFQIVSTSGMSPGDIAALKAEGASRGWGDRVQW